MAEDKGNSGVSELRKCQLTCFYRSALRHEYSKLGDVLCGSGRHRADVAFIDTHKEVLPCIGHKKTFTSQEIKKSPLFCFIGIKTCTYNSRHESASSGDALYFRLKNINKGHCGLAL